jgi:LacI family transcriptional regulator
LDDGGRTLKALALQLGVSAATVSRALAGHPRISLETRDRVRAAAQAAGYVPNRAARTLVTGRGSGFVGLMLQDAGYGREHSYLGELVQGLGSGLAAHDIDLFLVFVPEGQSELHVLRNIVSSRRADALVLGRTAESDERVDSLLDAGFPFVTHGRTAAEDPPFDWIDTDGAVAFAEGFALLHALGHRRFGLVSIEEPMTFRRHRTDGLRAAMAGRDASLTVAASPRHDAARRTEVIRAMLADPDRPTAVLCLFDGLALSVLEIAGRMGLRVPEDLSVIGFDNIGPAAQARLTTFDCDTLVTARDLADVLVARLAAPRAPFVRRLVRPRLVPRASHGPAPQVPRSASTR